MRSKLSLSLIIFSQCCFLPAVRTENLPFFDKSCKYELAKNEHFPEIVLTSFNTWGLPVTLPGHDQNSRFENMGYFLLHTNSDILCLQESFHKKLRKKLISTLKVKYQTINIKNKNSLKQGLIPMDCQGGLLTFSVFPVVSECFLPFPDNDYSLIEKIGGKGVLWTIINVNGKFINILNTHLYAGESDKAEKIRIEQLKLIQKLILEQASFKDYPTIFSGDFNINHPDLKPSPAYDFITESMCFIDTAPRIGPDNYTYSGAENPYISNKNYNTKLDYTFIYDPSSTLKTCESERILHKIPVSDHFGWKCRIYQ